jgi:glycosyltransferase involved in cell wall biosynthesis
MGVSVLIPAFNEEQTLLRLLPSLHQAVQLNNQITEIVLVSSPSTDRTQPLCAFEKECNRYIQHVQLAQWIPKYKALVHGASVAANEWLLVLDADVQASGHTLAALASLTQPSPGIVQARNVPDCLDAILASALDNASILLVWASLTSLAWHWIRSERPELRWAVSAHCYLCHRKILPTYWPSPLLDDITVGLNCSSLGHIIHYAPHLSVTFRPAQTWRDFCRQKLRNRIGLAQLRRVAPDETDTLRRAFRSCLSRGECLDKEFQRRYAPAVTSLLAIDALLWWFARTLQIVGIGKKGKWRPVRSTKETFSSVSATRSEASR